MLRRTFLKRVAAIPIIGWVFKGSQSEAFSGKSKEDIPFSDLLGIDNIFVTSFSWTHRCQHCGRLNSLQHHFYFCSKYFRCYSCDGINQYNKFKNDRNNNFEEKYCQKAYKYCSGGMLPPPERLNEYYISSKWIEHADGCWSNKYYEISGKRLETDQEFQKRIKALMCS